MKRLLLSIVTFLSLAPLCLAMGADETSEVSISTNDPVQSHLFNADATGATKVEVRIAEEDETGFWIDVVIFNEDQETYLPIFIFDSPYTKKELKKHKDPKIELKGNLFTDVENVMSASFSFPDGQRTMALKKDTPVIIENESEAYLNSQKIEFGETATLLLPIYIVDAKSSKKDKKKGTFSKVVINRWLLFELNITANGQRKPKIDEALNELRSELGEIADELTGHVFCISKKHKPKVSEQRKEYRERFEDLRQRANTLLKQQAPGSPEMEAYNDFLRELGECENSINDKSLEYTCDDCNNSRKNTGGGGGGGKTIKKHSCKYCTANIASQMSQIATAVKRSGKATSNQLSEANGLYNCAKARKVLTTGIKNDYNTITSKGGGGDSGGTTPTPKKHSCNYCKVNIAKRMSQIASTVKRSGKATSQQVSEANGLYNCAKARNALTAGIKNDYATITKK